MFKIKGKDFDEKQMSTEFSRDRQIENTINAYFNFAVGKKTLCFNVDIEHSLKMHNACIAHDINSRHIDSDTKSKYSKKQYRKDTFEWVEKTPNAFLNNVGIATIGTDIPSVEVVIVNKSTTSFSLFKQMIGRGGRPYLYPETNTYMDSFILLDMGDNIEAGGMGRYNDDVDWEYIFWNPKLPKPGVSSVKTCPDCGAINYVSARFCTANVEDWFEGYIKQCGHIFPVKDVVDDEIIRKMVKIGDSVDVKRNIEFFSDRSEWYSFHETINQILNIYKKENENIISLDSDQLNQVFEICLRKGSEWFKIKGKRKFANFGLAISDKVINGLTEKGFLITPEEIAEFKKAV